jgi:glutamine amidotransferase-like uncharacterized protein
MRKICCVSFLLLVSTILTACRSVSGNSCVPTEHPAKPGDQAPVLLFSGAGTSPCDVVAIEAIMDSIRLDYTTVNSAQLNGLTGAQLGTYRLLLMPGGNFIDMGKSLTTATAANIHNAVHNGLNYLGICAGGFLAGKSSYYNGFNLASGVTFGFYSAEEMNVHKAALPITTAGGDKMDQYWEDGPQFTGWGAVVAKYPDNKPATVEGTLGSGRVILTGIHAEAPENWRSGLNFSTPANADNAYASKLIRTTLLGSSLPHY